MTHLEVGAAGYPARGSNRRPVGASMDPGDHRARTAAR